MCSPTTMGIWLKVAYSWLVQDFIPLTHQSSRTGLQRVSPASSQPLTSDVRPHMLWVVIPVVVVALAVLVGAKHRMPRRGWFIGAIIIICVQFFYFYVDASPSWELQDVIASCFFLSLLPWLAVASYLWFSPYLEHPVVTALGVPAVYFPVLVVGLAVGDMSGLVPQ